MTTRFILNARVGDFVTVDSVMTTLSLESVDNAHSLLVL
jgi:hypothetical protein